MRALELLLWLFRTSACLTSAASEIEIAQFSAKKTQVQTDAHGSYLNILIDNICCRVMGPRIQDQLISTLNNIIFRGLNLHSIAGHQPTRSRFRATKGRRLHTTSPCQIHSSQALWVIQRGPYRRPRLYGREECYSSTWSMKEVNY